MPPLIYAVRYSEGGQPSQMMRKGKTTVLARLKRYCHAQGEENEAVGKVDDNLVDYKNLKKAFHR
ncbi:MAG: hypothetical protein M1358_23775 [Chloroflexi bacterium]|nr:hypothetical protein [Chloroflexota bacterium]